MIYPHGNDYIKYLNDESAYGLTYDQWKDKKVREELMKDYPIYNGKKTQFQYPKFK